jgi:hypothetical protein
MNLWWGYLHKSGKIQVKVLFNPGLKQDDREYAIEEMEQGNDNIQAVTPCSFEAENREEAIRIASRLLGLVKADRFEKIAREL